ncbi:unnamed protein product [Ectocarpus sp. 8 AP-2014]
MDAGANGKVGWRGCHGRTLLGAAAFGRSEKMVRTLLTAGATDDVNVLFGGNSLSALHVAAAGGGDDSCRALMIAGADPNVRDRGQRSPLHLAAGAGHHRVAGMLLLNKADVQAKTANQQTLLSTWLLSRAIRCASLSFCWAVQTRTRSMVTAERHCSRR